MCCSISVSAEEIERYTMSNANSFKGTSEVPIDINVNEPRKELSMTFNESMEVRTIISGPKGIIFNDDIKGNSNTTININFRGSEDGDYEVLLIDTSGNVTDSSFYISGAN